MRVSTKDRLMVVAIVATTLAAGPAAYAAESRAATAPASTPSASAGTHAVLTPAQRKALEDAHFVYIQSTRKDGNLSRPAEIWFAFFDDAVWVASAPTSWRVKRIKAKRP